MTPIDFVLTDQQKALISRVAQNFERQKRADPHPPALRHRPDRVYLFIEHGWTRQEGTILRLKVKNPLSGHTRIVAVVGVTISMQRQATADAMQAAGKAWLDYVYSVGAAR